MTVKFVKPTSLLKIILSASAVMPLLLISTLGYAQVPSDPAAPDSTESSQEMEPTPDASTEPTEPDQEPDLGGDASTEPMDPTESTDPTEPGQGSDLGGDASTEPMDPTEPDQESDLGTDTTSTPPERVGVNGEYDEMGLAKRVALAFNQDPEIGEIESLHVAQAGSTVVLKGLVPSQTILDKMIAVASEVDGATAVDTNQVTLAQD